MSSLTPDQRRLLKRRQARFDDFFYELAPVLVEFIRRLEMPEPERVMVNAASYLPDLDSWLQEQVVKPDDEAWLMARLTYFIGEYYVQRLDGLWFVNEDPRSPLFARYVVGEFYRLSGSHVLFDPNDVAVLWLEQHPAKSLIQVLDGVDAELAATLVPPRTSL